MMPNHPSRKSPAFLVPQSGFVPTLVFVLAGFVGQLEAQDNKLRELPIGETVGDQAQILELMAEVESVVRAWRDNTDLQGSFELRDSGLEKSRELALEKTDVRTEESRANADAIVAKGSFAKSGMALRYFRESNQTIGGEPSAGGYSGSGWFSFHVCAANGMEMIFSPRQETSDGKQLGGNVNFGKFDFLGSEDLTTRELRFFPLLRMSGHRGSIFKRSPSSVSSNLSFVNTESGFVIGIVEQIKVLAADNSNSKAAVFEMRTDYQFQDSEKGPVLVRVSKTTPDGQDEILMFDHVDCGGGFLFPRGLMVFNEMTVRFVDNDRPKKRTRVMSWYSEDVGPGSNDKSNFDIVVPADSRWSGYSPSGGDPNKIERVGKSVTINLFDVDKEQVHSSYQPSARPRPKGK